jgi:16S rRNA (uracil1498-N3)-methyltransferase
MSLPRFYSPFALAIGSSVELPSSAAHHAAKVLRMRVGDALVLFDGRGGEYSASLEGIDKKRVVVSVNSHVDIERESPLAVTLVQAVSSRDRMDVTLQKAVELGVARIVPVMSQRSVVRLSGERADQRVQHWQQVVVAACEQCGRNQVPHVEALIPLVTFLERPQPSVGRWMLSPHAEHALRSLEKPLTAVELLVGPEGGLTAEEERAAGDAGFMAVRIGPRILRTETAAPALLAAMQALWGDF